MPHLDKQPQHFYKSAKEKSEHRHAKSSALKKKLDVKHDRSEGLKFSHSYGANKGEKEHRFHGHRVTNQPKGNLLSSSNSYGK